MARSGKRRVMVDHYLKRFRRRRILAFLRRSNLPATFDALKHETPVFLDVRFLQRLVVDGRWQEAREYINRFQPCSDNAYTALEFIARLNVLEDLDRGKLGGDDAADDLERQLEAIPSTMDDPHYTEAVRTVFSLCSHPAYWDPVDWRRIRVEAVQVVKDVVMRTPEFRHLLRLPPCPSNPCDTIPFGFGGSRRHNRKNIGRMSASLLARRFLQKARRSSSPRTQGLSCEPIDLEYIFFETLQDGDQKLTEQSDSCSEGIPGAPVGLFIGKSFGIAPANAVTKPLSQECDAESTNHAKLKPTTGEFCPDVVDAPSGGGLDPDHVFNEIDALCGISGAMTALVRSICTLGGADHRMYVEKLMEQETLLYELRIDCHKAKYKGCAPMGNFSAQ